VTSFLARYRDRIVQLADQHGASHVRVFGSHAHGEAAEGSDVDILVDMAADRSLFDHVALWQDLEDLLGCRVDVVLDGGISPYLQDRILAEAEPL